MCLLKPDCVGKVVGVKLTNACFTHKFDALHDILDTGCLLFLCILEICWNVFKIYFNRRRIYGTQIKLYFYIKFLFYSSFIEAVPWGCWYLLGKKEGSSSGVVKHYQAELFNIVDCWRIILDFLSTLSCWTMLDFLLTSSSSSLSNISSSVLILL